MVHVTGHLVTDSRFVNYPEWRDYSFRGSRRLSPIYRKARQYDGQGVENGRSPGLGLKYQFAL
jgi:hypothetical protein